MQENTLNISFEKFQFGLMITVCDFSRGSSVFMVLVVGPFLSFMSDSVSIRDPRHLHVFHKSFSSGSLSLIHFQLDFLSSAGLGAVSLLGSF